MTQVEKGFLGERLNQTIVELEAVRATLKAKTKRLEEAEASLRFYADPRNYVAFRLIPGDREVFQDRLKGDHSPADNDPNTLLAGRKAREYFKQYETA